MTYSEFLDAVVSFVRENVPSDREISLHTIVKTNDTILDGLMIAEPEKNIAPTIYLNEFYDRYLSGTPLDAVFEQILSAYEVSIPGADLDVSFYTDYEKVKTRVACKLVNLDRNRKFLRDVPYLRFLDLAVVFYCLLCETDQGSATVLVKKSHLDLWGVTVEELFAQAKWNTPRLLSFRLDDMNTLFADETNSALPSPSRMFILSNRLRLNGASCLLDEDLMAAIAEEHRSSYYVLPSSVHEVILLFQERKVESDGPLQRMVREINRTKVADDEVLSDRLYYYDRSHHALGVYGSAR